MQMSSYLPSGLCRLKTNEMRSFIVEFNLHHRRRAPSGVKIQAQRRLQVNESDVTKTQNRC